MPISFPQSGAGPSSRPSNESYPSFPSSLPSSGSDSGSDSSSDYSSDEEDERERALIREEWEESLRQMQMLFSIVLVPFFGKWMGRRWSYWGEEYNCSSSHTYPADHSAPLAFTSLREVPSSGVGEEVFGAGIKDAALLVARPYGKHGTARY